MLLWTFGKKERMLRYILGVVLVLVVVSCHYLDPHHDTRLHAPEVPPAKGTPWPLPQNYVTKSDFFILRPENFKFILNKPKCDILVDAVDRYQKLTFLSGCAGESLLKPKKTSYHGGAHDPVGELFNITINVAGSCEKYPYMDMDEQYILKINDPDQPNQAILFSSTVWGALRGLETFSQIVYEIIPGMFVVNSTSILDFPRFSFRGVLLDTSRHFVPLPVILQNLDAMTYSKMNVFHWHIVDDQSFPYESIQFPDLSKRGSFNPKTHVYTQDDIAQVIEYARLRGIRVLPEFDSPGHSLSWGKSQDGLLTQCYKGKTPIPGSFGPIDPTNEKNFDFIQSLFKEIATVFPDCYMHLGGDEVSFQCWQSNPFVTSFMKAHKFGSDYSRLEGYYMQRLLDIVKKYNKSYIVWQEVYDNGVKVKPDTVIHVWKDGFQAELSNVTSFGLKTILSSCWYLNYINYGDDWENFYACDPHDFKGTASQKKLVVGGEACMWGEYVDGSNLISRTWPRAAVVGERLWSNSTVKSASQAMPRLEEFRCNLIKRGLKAEPIIGPGYCECDYLS